MNRQTLSLMGQLLSTDISAGTIIAVAIGSFFIAVIFILAVWNCIRFSKIAKIEMHSGAKIIVAAVGPMIASLLAVFGINVPVVLLAIVTIALDIGIAIWNFYAAGVFYGLLFSVVHIVTGLFAGLGVGGIVIMGVFVVAVLLIGPLDSGKSSSGSASGYIYDVQTNESFYVNQMNGVQQIQRNGNWVTIRPGVYAGRYIDDYGNEYADSYD